MVGVAFPKEYGGNATEDFDPFYEVIAVDEMAR